MDLLVNSQDHASSKAAQASLPVKIIAQGDAIQKAITVAELIKRRHGSDLEQATEIREGPLIEISLSHKLT